MGISKRNERFRGFLLALPGALTLAAAILQISPAPANGAVIEVTASGEVIDEPGDGECSLIEAVVNAEEDRQVHSDDCAPGDGPDVVVLPEGSEHILVGAYGDHDTNALPIITSDIQIVAGGASIVAEFAPSRVFEVQGGNLELRDAFVAGARQAEEGGAVRILGGRLAVEGGWFEGNEVTDRGGAIFGESAVVEVRDTTFLNNLSQGVGGAMALTDGTVLETDNVRWDSNSAEKGGALHLSSVQAVIVGGSFWSNQAGDWPGFYFGEYIPYASAIHVESVDGTDPEEIAGEVGLQVRGVTFLDNSHLAIYQQMGTLFIADSKIWLNDRALWTGSNTAATLESVDVHYNGLLMQRVRRGDELHFELPDRSSSRGYGIEEGGGVVNFGTMRVQDSDVLGNHGVVGGFLNRGQLNVVNSKVAGNAVLFELPYGYTGAGGIINVGDATIRSSEIAFNSGRMGGGIVSHPARASLATPTLWVIDSEVRFNHGFDVGGGIFCFATDCRIEDTTVNLNSADLLGGGVLIANASAEIVNSVIAQNYTRSAEADDSGGFGLLVTDNFGRLSEDFGIEHHPDPKPPSSVEIVHSTFFDNNRLDGVVDPRASDVKWDLQGGSLVSITNSMLGRSATSCFRVRGDIENVNNASVGGDCLNNAVDPVLGTPNDLPHGPISVIESEPMGFWQGPGLYNAAGAIPTAYGVFEGSITKEAANPSVCPLSDRNGQPRSAGQCDIGAFEGSFPRP